MTELLVAKYRELIVVEGPLEKTWTQPMLDAYMRLGERCPDIAGEIYVVASNY